MIASWGKPGVERLSMEPGQTRDSCYEPRIGRGPEVGVEKSIKAEPAAGQGKASNLGDFDAAREAENQRLAGNQRCLPICSHCGQPITESCYSDGCGGVFHRSCVQIRMAQRALGRPNGLISTDRRIGRAYWAGIGLGLFLGCILGLSAGFGLSP